MFKIVTILCCLTVIIYSDDFLSKQNDYNIKFTWGELVSYNKTVYKYFKVVCFKFNRSIPAINMTLEFKTRVDSTKTYLIIQGYKFLSNEYREFPLRFQIGYCGAIEKNIAGSRDALRCGNIPDCQFEKDRVYHACNVFPDESRFPPLIPNGEYKIEITMINEKAILAVGNGYGQVSRPLKGWKP